VNDCRKPLRIFLLALTSLFAFGPITAQSELRAALSATEIEELDSVQLVIRDLGAREILSPDLSGLDENFLVLGVNTSSQYQIINGRAQSWVDYSISLQPKNTGVVTIDPIAIGNKRSKPLQLTIRELSSEARQEIANLIFYELTLSDDSVYVQSQLLLTRQLIYAEDVQLYGGQLEAPRIAGAQVFALGEGTSSVVQRNGRTMGSFKQRYAIFPERSGELLIPDENVNASVQIRRGGSIKRKTVKVSTGERVIEVKGIPSEYPSDAPWLPATAVTASQRYTPSADQSVKVGDTINRTLTITVFGNTGASIAPHVTSLDPTIFKSYAQPASIDNGLTGGSLVGQRIESIDLVPIMRGAHALPGTNITWWNTDTHEVMNTSVPSMALSVTGAAISVAKARDDAKIQEPVQRQIGGTVQTHANGLDWWTLALAALLVLVLVLMRRIGGSRQKATAHAYEPHNLPLDRAATLPRVSRKQVLKVFDTDPPITVRQQLAAYLIHHYDAPQEKAFAAFQASSPEAAQFTRALAAACFANADLTEASRREGKLALESLKDQARNPKPASALPVLYPG
jgi:hypothetical protein